MLGRSSPDLPPSFPASKPPSRQAAPIAKRSSNEVLSSRAAQNERKANRSQRRAQAEWNIESAGGNDEVWNRFRLGASLFGLRPHKTTRQVAQYFYKIGRIHPDAA